MRYSIEDLKQLNPTLSLDELIAILEKQEIATADEEKRKEEFRKSKISELVGKYFKIVNNSHSTTFCKIKSIFKIDQITVYTGFESSIRIDENNLNYLWFYTDNFSKYRDNVTEISSKTFDSVLLCYNKCVEQIKQF